MTRSKFMRGAALFLVMVLVSVMFSACAAGDSSSPSTAAVNAPGADPSGEEPFPIDILTLYHTAVQPLEDNAIIAEIEKLANVKLNITWSAKAGYDDKVNVTIASADYPSVMLINGDYKPIPVEIEAVRAGMFWKVGDYLQEYENLRQVNPDIIKNASVDGELWGMFRTRPLARDGFYFRTDWMKNLGLEAPKSPEHLLEILRAFVNDDPDGNGQNDTGGMAQDQSLDAPIAALAPYFGLPNNWDTTDGKLSPIYFDERYFQMIDWIKTAYDEGLMNRDFPTVNSNQRDEMMSGQYGFAFASIDKGDKSIVALKQLNEEADLTVGVTFTEAPEQYIWGRSGWNGKYYISKRTVEEEADMRRIMKYFDVMHSPEISNLIAYGFEGTHYNRGEGNTVTVSEEQKTKFLQEVEIIEQIGFRYTVNNFDAVGLPFYQAQFTDIFKNGDSLTRPDPTTSYNSETYNEKGSDLTTLIQDNNTKYITGAIDEAGWRAGLEQWRQMGGDDLIAEYQAVYDSENS